MKKRGLVFLFVLLGSLLAYGQEWSEPVRGSWVADDGLVLVNESTVADIVVSEDAHSCVKQAAKFLASDIEKITGQKPSIVSQIPAGKPFIQLKTVADGMWEAHRIQTTDNGIILTGSNPRGTAFAVYTLCERLGVDPLYIWTGYVPEKHEVLTVKAIDYAADEPTFKYRGLFHDDEDLLPVEKASWADIPRPYGGTVPEIWYERFFETSLRLRMNMVAPFTRTRRAIEVRQMASDWGLFYTSHHYDILLSNPFGYEQFGKAESLGIEGPYSWYSNREGILKYWQNGLDENREFDCIWPVGLRGTDDHAYKHPEGTTHAQKKQIWVDVVNQQVEMAKASLPADKDPVFHFMMYGDVAGAVNDGLLDLPEEVMFIWADDADGNMPSLDRMPKDLGEWKHGVYYHLAYWTSGKRKQTVHTIPPQRVEKAFRRIVDAGATEFMLNNVSELREYIMNARFIAEICWDAKTAFEASDAAGRYTEWWCREYFGTEAADDAVTTYNNYFDIIHSYDRIWQGSIDLELALTWSRIFKNHYGILTDERPEILEDINLLNERVKRYDNVFEIAHRAQRNMNPEQARFFHQNALLGMLMDYRPAQAADIAFQYMLTRPKRDGITKVKLVEEYLANEVMAPLTLLNEEVEAAEWDHLDNWYKPTGMRLKTHLMNPRYGYYRMLEFLEEINR